MRKSIFLSFAILTLVSCVRAPEDKVNSIIQERVKNSLFFPESYQAIETVVDSAFAPKDDPVFYDRAMNLYRLFVAVEECRSKAARAERVMNAWIAPYLNGIGQLNYRHAKYEFEKYNEQVEYYTAKIEKEKDYLQGLINCQPAFIGFKFTHRFRAKTNSGNVTIGEKVFITNKDMTQVLVGYDSDEEEYMLVQRFYQTIKEAHQQCNDSISLDMKEFEDELNRCRDNQ